VNEFHAKLFDTQSVRFRSRTHQVIDSYDMGSLDQLEQALSNGTPNKAADAGNQYLHALATAESCSQLAISSKIAGRVLTIFGAGERDSIFLKLL
jgi:hypothetical protein